MPKALGVLASDQPIPNGRVQLKRAAAAYGVWRVSNQIAEGTVYPDGAGGGMEISVTPSSPCLWIVRANVMIRGAPGNCPGWFRVDWQIRLSPADLDGLNQHVGTTHVYDGNVVSYRTFAGGTCFRLDGGQAYKASLTHGYSDGYYQDVYIAPDVTRLIGRTVGEGVL